MLGRCQPALCRGLVAGLQLHQQQCLQVEVLGMQAARTYMNDYRQAKQQTRKIRETLRRNAAVDKVLSEMKRAGAAQSAVSSTNSSSTASTGSDADLAAAVPVGSGPMVSPLSQVPNLNSSTTSAAAPAAAAAPPALPGAAAAAAAKGDTPKGWAPAWLSNIMDYPRRRREPPQQRPGTTAGASPLQGTAPDSPKPSPLQDKAPDMPAAAAAGQEEGPQDDGWQEYAKFKNMDVDQYHSLIKQEPTQGDVEQPPRPQRPPYRGPNARYSARMDLPRLAFARYQQQGNLITVMSAADKARIHQDPEAAYKDYEFVTRLAQAAAMTEGAVRDMIFQYTRRRETFDLLYTYREKGGKMPLVTDDLAVNLLVDELQERKKKDQAKAVLKNRDPEDCQLRAWAKVIGKNRLCPKTQLPYGMCCGSIKTRKKALKA